MTEFMVQMNLTQLLDKHLPNSVDPSGKDFKRYMRVVEPLTAYIFAVPRPSNEQLEKAFEIAEKKLAKVKV